MTRPLKIYVADFETTTDENDCRVWGWGIDTLDETSWNDGINIESFCDHVKRLKGKIYFHNLKFDITFLIDYLFKIGYKHVNTDKLRPGEFSTLVSDMGKVYSVTIYWRQGQRNEFRDSAKKFPNMSVAKIAKSFNQPEPKGDIDYHEYRPVGHQLTPEERDYIRRDIHIICRALKITFDAGLRKLTVGSDALSGYKKLKGDNYSLLYPVFGHALDAEIRRAYRGGFTYMSDRFARDLTTSGMVFDVNSLYPYIMYDRELPYGMPKYHEKFIPDEHSALSIFPVTIVATIKENHIPCIQIKNSGQFAPTEYLSRIDEPTTIVVTNVDWKLYNEHYDIFVLEYHGGWTFTSTTGTFTEYIEYWSHVKETSTGGQREIAKLMLNSLYGKFASNPNVTGKFPIYEDERVKWRTGATETRPPVYTPLGVFITSWARDYTIRHAQANFWTFAYADTDSLHLVTDIVPSGMEIHPTKLGAWKHEYSFTQAKYVRAKAYLERLASGDYVNRIAGLPTRISEGLTFDDVYDGAIFHGKLVPKNVPGGIVLQDLPYEMKF